MGDGDDLDGLIDYAVNDRVGVPPQQDTPGVVQVQSGPPRHLGKESDGAVKLSQECCRGDGAALPIPAECFFYLVEGRGMKPNFGWSHCSERRRRTSLQGTSSTFL